jgi:fructuronate reductase
LPALPQFVRQPQYDRESLQMGMAHIGVGAFHRCHQAEFIDDMLEAQFGPWGVVGVNLTAPSLADLVVPQDCLYSCTLRQDAHAETRIIGALREVIDLTDKAPRPPSLRSVARDFCRDVPKAYVEVIEESFSGFKSLSATLAVAMALALRVEQRSSENWPRTRRILQSASRRRSSASK